MHIQNVTTASPQKSYACGDEAGVRRINISAIKVYRAPRNAMGVHIVVESQEAKAGRGSLLSNEWS